MEKRFRLRTKKLFLTYPKCSISKENALEILTKVLPNFKTYCIAEEEHKDGTAHLHAFIEFKNPETFNNHSFADLEGNHGSYESARNRKNSLKYICKDGRFISNLSNIEIQEITRVSEEEAAKMLLNDDSITEVIEKRPALLFKYTQIKTSIEAFKERRNRKSEEEPLVEEIPNSLGLRLLVDTDNKQCHHWVWSREPNRGKTTGLVEKALQLPNSILYDPRSVYHDAQESTQYVIIDEMCKGQMKAQQLNKMCDGTASYRKFMKGEIRLRSKPIIIVCSNFSIEEVFPIMFKPVSARFIEINID